MWNGQTLTHGAAFTSMDWPLKMCYLVLVISICHQIVNTLEVNVPSPTEEMREFWRTRLSSESIIRQSRWSLHLLRYYTYTYVRDAGNDYTRRLKLASVKMHMFNPENSQNKTSQNDYVWDNVSIFGAFSVATNSSLFGTEFVHSH